MGNDDGENRRQQAGFSIFLDRFHDEQGNVHWETRLYHAESGAEVSFEGAAPERWIPWMLERLGDEQPERTSSGPPPGAQLSDLGVEVVEVVLTEQHDSPTSTRLAGGRDGDPLDTISAAVVVQLSGLNRMEHVLGAALLRGVLNAQMGRARTEPT